MLEVDVRGGDATELTEPDKDLRHDDQRFVLETRKGPEIFEHGTRRHGTRRHGPSPALDVLGTPVPLTNAYFELQTRARVVFTDVESVAGDPGGASEEERRQHEREREIAARRYSPLPM